MTIALVVTGLLAGTVLLWRLPPLPLARGDEAAPTVVIPARDEAATLPVLLASLAAQGLAPAEVVVVDDSSSDGTTDVAVAGGARVVAARPLPRGWAGKPWALQAGIDDTVGATLVLLDADLRLAPDALARLVGAHAALAPDGLLSVQPFHAVERPYEQLSAVPNVVALLASGIGAVRPSPHPGLAFGPCLVTSRAALDAVGGFRAVAGEVLEDVALARAYAAAGRPVVGRAGRDVVAFRMHPAGARQLVDGWARTLAGGARAARPVPMVGAVLWVGALLAITFEAGHSPTPEVAIAAVAAAGQLAWMLRRVGSFRWWVAVAFPVAVAAFVGLFAWSLVQRAIRHRVTWRGRQLEVR